MISKKKKCLFFLPFFAELIMLFVLYSFTFLQSDDFTFAVRTNNMSDIWNFYLNYYSVAGSRMANIIAQIFLLADLSVWKVVTPLVVTGISLLMYYCVKGRILPQKETFWQDFTLAGVCAFFSGLIPIGNHLFADSFLWLSGSANYLYPLFLMLAGLLPFWNALRGRPPIRRGLQWLCPVSFTAAGLLHEQTALALFAFSAVSLFLLHRSGRKISVLLKVMTAVGAAVLVFTFTCPGAYSRLNDTGLGSSENPVLHTLSNMEVYFSAYIKEYWFVPAVFGLSTLFFLSRFPVKFEKTALSAAVLGIFFAPAFKIISCFFVLDDCAFGVLSVLLAAHFTAAFVVLRRAALKDEQYRYLPVLYLSAWASQAIPAVLGGIGRPVFPMIVLAIMFSLCVLDGISAKKRAEVQLTAFAAAVFFLSSAFAPVSWNCTAYQDIMSQAAAAKAGKTNVVVLNQGNFNMEYCYYHAFTKSYKEEIRQYFNLPERVQLKFEK